jgi:hypothetical protein
MKKLTGLDEAIMGMVSAMIEGERINTLVYSGNKIHDILYEADIMATIMITVAKNISIR